MDGKTNGGQEVTQGAQDTSQQQGQEQQETQQQGQSQVGCSETDYEKQIAERDEKIASLEAQVAEAAKNAETESESESAPNPLTGRAPFRHHCRCGGTGADHGETVPEARGGVQAARRAAAQREGDRLRGGRARDRRRPVEPRRLGQKGPGRGARRRGGPLPDGRGPAAAQARERAAQEGGRDAFKSGRPLRRQAAVGAGAKGARFASIPLSEGRRGVSGMCSAPGVTRQGHCARRSRGPRGRAPRAAEPAGEISGACEASRRICGAPEVFAEL